MKERPILMAGSMVRASLGDLKTKTRRVVKPQPQWKDGRLWWRVKDGYTSIDPGCNNDVAHGVIEACPYGAIGDRLWVRESWRPIGDAPLSECVSAKDIMFLATATEAEAAIFKWRPSIHMPRWACRLVLEIVDIRVERLQSISAADCWAEGIPHSPDVNPVHEFEELWDSLNAKRAPWASNPHVWVITFKRLP